MSRPRTGSLEYTQRDGYIVRIKRGVVRERIKLETRSMAVARARVAALLEDPHAKFATTETLLEASARIHEVRHEAGYRTAREAISRIRRFAEPVIGRRRASEVTTHDVNAILDYALGKGQSRQSIKHLKNALAAVYVQLVRESAVETNPVADASLPKMPTTMRRERAVLEDFELGIYLAYEHPDERHRAAVKQRQTMALTSRVFGGLRTNDLHSLRWEHLDAPNFRWGWAPRTKSKAPQKLEIHELLRPFLRDWWETMARPLEGIVFPAMRGERAGERKSGVSHAGAFRRDLERAFRAASAQGVAAPRPGTIRWRELFETTDYTLPVDFHSWRRAFAQALADAGANAQTAAILAGHSSLQAHQRYLQQSSRMRALPAGAAPDIQLSFAKNSGRTSGTVLDAEEKAERLWADALRARKDSNLRPSAPEAGLERGAARILRDWAGDRSGTSRDLPSLCQNSRAKRKLELHLGAP